jgi:hypothetical protein
MPKMLHTDWQVVPVEQLAFDVQPQSQATAGEAIKNWLSRVTATTANPRRRFMRPPCSPGAAECNRNLRRARATWLDNTKSRAYSEGTPSNADKESTMEVEIKRCFM